MQGRSDFRGVGGSDEFARTAAKLKHLHTIFVWLVVRNMILIALFKIVYTPWMDRYFTINNEPLLLIVLKENHGVRSYDSKNTDMKIIGWKPMAILGKKLIYNRKKIKLPKYAKDLLTSNWTHHRMWRSTKTDLLI